MERVENGLEAEQLEAPPPIPERVAQRALVLAQVACRGFIEKDAARAGSFWERARSWFVALGIEGELEPKEEAILSTPLGELALQDSVNASWRCEGLVVLAWALGRWEMPRFGEQVVAADVANALGFLEPVERTVLHEPVLKSPATLSEYADTCFTVHWRLRQQQLRPEQLDMNRLASEVWFGPLSLEGLELVEGDLGISGIPVFKLDEALFRSALSIAQERHQAANWLLGGDAVYSEVDTST